MIFNEKFLQNADLVIPFRRCSLGKPVSDCPFIKYWNEEDFEEQLMLILTLPSEELDNLRRFHRRCMLEQVKRVQSEFSEKESRKNV